MHRPVPGPSECALAMVIFKNLHMTICIGPILTGCTRLDVDDSKHGHGICSVCAL